MKVKELIELLENENPEALVVMSGDSEGNYFSELCDIDPNSKYCDGEIGLKKLTKDLKKEGFCEEDVAPEDWDDAVVLWP